MSAPPPINIAEETISGIFAGLLSSTLTYPLDLAKTIVQADPSVKNTSTLAILTDIVRRHGVAGLFLGLQSEYFKVVIQNGLYFASYNTIKSLFTQRPSVFETLGIGIIAGCSTQLAVNPISVVQTRLQTGKDRRGAIDTLKEIIANEGLLALYRGMGPSLILTWNPAIQFMVFDKLKAWWLKMKRKRTVPPGQSCDLSAAEAFLIGAIAKAVATIATYPYIMGKARLQFSKGADRGVMHMLVKVVETDGFFGLYKGMQTQIVKSVLGAALLFMFKDAIQQQARQAAVKLHVS